MKLIDKILELAKKEFKIKNVRPEKQAEILDRIINQYENKNLNFDKKIYFHSVFSLNKKRRVAEILDKFCLEYYLLKYFSAEIPAISKFSLNNMKIPTMKILDHLNNLKSNEFTIIRFDFKNYYNNLSNEYIFKKYISKMEISEEEKYFLEAFTKQIPYCFAGLPTSNKFAEIIDADLENELSKEFNKIAKSICFHFGDDFNIFVNKIINKEKALNIINQTIQNVFHSKNIKVENINKEKIHTSGDKFTCLTNNDLPIKFSFLGYDYDLFLQNGKLDLSFGVYDITIDKYISNLKEVLLEFKDNIPAQKVILELQTKRIIFKPNLAENKFCSTRFNEQTKCLKFAKDSLNQKTTNFLNNAILNCYNELNINLPYFLKNKNYNKFNLYYNVINSKTLYFNEKTGVKKEKLIEFCKPFGIQQKEYNTMALELVKKCKVNY